MLASLSRAIFAKASPLASCSGGARALSSFSLPKKVTIYEVGPRDGLQNEQLPISTDVKIQFIDKLTAAGLKAIEATSFVSPKWVPQLADASDVMQSITRRPGVLYPVLTPNMKGLENAIKVGAREVAIFAAASEAFSLKNINCNIDESLKRFDDVVAHAKREDIAVRGYVSVAVDCPYAGQVDPRAAAAVAAALHQMGCYEVSMGDTTGAGTPQAVSQMLEETMKVVPVHQLAAHMHDTYGQAVANIYRSLQLGVSVIDTAAAGLGGCPFAKGAAGNVATEDVCYLLDGLGIQHGVDVRKILEASQFICRHLGRPNTSKAAMALQAIS